jgi:hypothetical protein
VRLAAVHVGGGTSDVWIMTTHEEHHPSAQQGEAFGIQLRALSQPLELSYQLAITAERMRSGDPKPFCCLAAACKQYLLSCSDNEVTKPNTAPVVDGLALCGGHIAMGERQE